MKKVKAKALMDFMKYSDADLLTKATAVSIGLKGNTYFPNTNAALEILDAASLQFYTAVSLAKNKDHAKLAEKKLVRDQLFAVMVALVDFVNYIAPGDTSIGGVMVYSSPITMIMV